MSYNTAAKKKENFKAMPLIEDNAQDTFNQMQNKFLEFIKIYDEISEYESKLGNLTRKEYDRIKDDM